MTWGDRFTEEEVGIFYVALNYDIVKYSTLLRQRQLWNMRLSF